MCDCLVSYVVSGTFQPYTIGNYLRMLRRLIVTSIYIHFGMLDFQYKLDTYLENSPKLNKEKIDAIKKNVSPCHFHVGNPFSFQHLAIHASYI